MKKPLVIHPLLVAIFPILFLYAQNMGEMKANQIFLLLGVSLGLALFMWLLFGLWLKDRAKAGLATSICVFFLFTFGHFNGLLGKQDIFVPRNALLAGMLLALGCCVYFIRRARSDFRTVTRVLNIAAAVVIALNAFTMISYQIRVTQIPRLQAAKMETTAQIPSSKPGVTEQTAQMLSTQPSATELSAQVPSTQPNTTEQAVQREVQSMPDIYFIVLDEYASPDVIKKYFNYDNEQFIRSLENKGFFVARDSTTPYRDTVINIASILNMEWITKNEFGNPPYESITNNKVVSRLQSLGYKYVYFGQWFEIDRYEIKADAYFNYYKESSPVKAELWDTLWKTTILNTVFEEKTTDNYYREGLIRTLDHLGKIPEMEGPKFIYAHIICPHDPFVFGPNGEPVDSGYAWYEYNERYLGQYKFITREIDKVIEDILKKSTIEPIIILQSDHGAKLIPEWNKILNAYHLPGDGRQLLDNAVSPVNTFRIIFNHYFNASYELLDDRLP
jgi:hypothetical protein